MGKGRASQGEDGRANGRVGNDLDPEDVGEARAHVLAKGAHNEQFALLVEEEDARQHFEGGRGAFRLEIWRDGRVEGEGERFGDVYYAAWS